MNLGHYTILGIGVFEPTTFGMRFEWQFVCGSQLLNEDV
jgi:hypothetical protein